MKKKILMAALTILLIFPFTAHARITVNVLSNYVESGQGILPNTGYTPWTGVIGRNAFTEGYIIIMGLSIASDSEQRLTHITLEQPSVSSDRLFALDSSVIMNRGGTILGATGGSGTITIPGGAPIPPNNTGGNAGNNFFIGIRMADIAQDRSSSTFRVPAAGVGYTPDPDAADIDNAALATGSIVCDLLVADVLPLSYNNLHDPYFIGRVPSYPLYAQYQPGEQIRPLFGVDTVIEYTGTAGEGSDEDFLVDPTQSWIPGQLVGATVFNLTTEEDVTSATVISNTANIIRTDAELEWEAGDEYRVFRRITADTYAYGTTPLEHSVPQVLPWETPTSALAFSCAQRNVVPSGTAEPHAPGPHGERLHSVTITVTDVGKRDFDPNKTFRTTPPDPDGETNHGITLWRDAAIPAVPPAEGVPGDGIWNPADDTRIRVTYSDGGTFRPDGDGQWTLTLYPWGIETIDLFAGDTYNYFIVIEQRSDYTGDEDYRQRMGQDYKIWIKPGDIVFGPVAYPVRYAGISENYVMPIYNNLFFENLAQARVDPVPVNAAVDRTYNVIPAIGINIASGPADTTWPDYNFSNTKIEEIRVELLAVENFDPHVDLAPLKNNDMSSGLTLWRDNKIAGNIGSFDAADTYVPTDFTGWTDLGVVYDPELGINVRKYSTTITLQETAHDSGQVYPYDYYYPYHDNQYRSTDFFLAFRTSGDIGYGSRFRLKIPSAGLWTTDGHNAKKAYNSIAAISREIRANVKTTVTRLTGETAEIGPGSPPTGVFRVDLADNASGKNPVLGGLTVEFHDRGNFSLTDLAPFTPVSPVYNTSTGWWDVTNLDPERLKQCGVVIYRDAALTNPVLIRRFARPTWPGAPAAYRLEFLNPENIPSTLYVAIRTSSTFTPGDSFIAAIVGWGLNQFDWDQWGSRAVPVTDINNLRTTSYTRKSSGIFNPSMETGPTLVHESDYDHIMLQWARYTGSNESFIAYEIYRDEGLIHTVYNINETTYYDRRDGATPPLDGMEYEYRVETVYWHAGSQVRISLGTITAQIYGFRTSQLPSDFRLAPGTSSVNVQWMDNSYVPGNPDTYEDRARRFLIRRTSLKDGTRSETTIASQWTPANPYNIYYAYHDGQHVSPAGTLVGTPLEPGAYLYEIFLQKDVPGGVSTSQPVARATAVFPEEDGKDAFPGEGGCFIATAVYGSSMAEEVVNLKKFRDGYLSGNRPGRALIRWYYRHSPPAADFIRDRSLLKSAVRTGLKPLIWLTGRLK